MIQQNYKVIAVIPVSLEDIETEALVWKLLSVDYKIYSVTYKSEINWSMLFLSTIKSSNIF